MSTKHNGNQGPERYEPTREDVLIGRVVDGEAGPGDWSELEHIARVDDTLWQRLAQAQRAHARLERAVEDEIAIAELIELPEQPSVVASFRGRMQSWGGWAAAAAVGLAWLGAGKGPAMMTGSGGGTPAVATLSPDDALQSYLDSGRKADRVVREMPLQLIDSRDLGTGKGREVIFVRPIVERMVVSDLRMMRVIKDEAGRERTVLDDQPADMDVLIRTNGTVTKD